MKRLLALAVMVVLAGCPANNTAQPVPPSPTPATGYEPPGDQPPPPPPPPASAPDAGSVAEPTSPQADGSPCLVAGDCTSGVCEGLGCGADTPGVCAPAKRGCTKDRRAYCSCDGVTFYGSGTCPGQRYAAKAACPNG